MRYGPPHLGTSVHLYALVPFPWLEVAMSVGGVYQCDIQKVLAGQYWTNRYHVIGANFEEATQVGQAIAAIERAETISSIFFTSLRISTPQAGDDAYQVTPLSYYGSVVAAGNPLPLFVVVRVVFSKGPGRPDVKYYKGMANKDALNDAFTYTQNLVAGLTEHLATPLQNIAGLSDALGQAYNLISIDGRIGMRQLRRGSKKKLQPIIPEE